ncbi:hypothetical protein B0H14DRAFT_3881009 [Mycena olivaceomarginata]|nr:hypothetical protein B0H14DRAFT_3881009 [Mycena olivaceomarginata]
MSSYAQCFLKYTKRHTPTPYPPATAAAASTRRVCLRACGAALSLADATARRCLPPNPLPPPVPRYAVAFPYNTPSTLNAGRPSSAPLQGNPNPSEGSVGITSPRQIGGLRCPFGDSFCASFLLGALGAEEVRAGEHEERRREECGRKSCLVGVVARTSLVFLLGNLRRKAPSEVVPGEKGTKRSLTKWLNRGVSGKGKAKAQTTTDTGRFIENVDGPSTKQ